MRALWGIPADHPCLTPHRAFDLRTDLAGALEIAIAQGFDRVLTSGGAPKAVGGLHEIHTSCGRAVPPPPDPREAAFGFTAPGRRVTDTSHVRALREAHKHAGQQVT